MRLFSQDSKKFFFVISFFLLAASFVLYGQGIRNGFVYDDAWQILDNPWIQDWKFLPTIFSSGVWNFLDFPSIGSGYYRPFMHVFFMLEYQLFGLDPRGYHVMSIVMHGFNASLLFLFIIYFLRHCSAALPEYVTGQRSLFAFLVALIFLAHPVNSEVVYWAATAPELLLACFSLLCFLSFFFLKSRVARLGLGLFFFICAFLSKETAIVIPGVLFFLYLLLWTGRDQSLTFYQRIKKTIVYTGPFFLVGAILLMLRSNVMTSSLLTDQPSWYFWFFVLLGTVAEIFIGHLALLFRLLPYSISHGYSPTNPALYGALAIALSGLIGIVSYWVWRTKYTFSPLVVLGSSVLVFFLLPALNYFQLGAYVWSERYLYLPSMGFALLVTTCSFWVFQHAQAKILRWFIVLITSFVFVWCVVSIQARAADWKDTAALFHAAVKAYPDKHDPHDLLFQLRCQTDIRQCQSELDLFCEKVVQSNQAPDKEACWRHTRTSHFLARTYLDAKEWDQAEFYYAELLAQKPELGEAWWALGVVALERDNNLVVAEKHLTKAQVFAPESRSVYQSLSKLRCQQGSYEAARASAAQALKYGAKQAVIDEILRTCPN